MFTHICANFTGNKVHAELILGLARASNRECHVFVPCKNRQLFGRNDPNSPYVSVTYFYVPSFLRYFQTLKIIYSILFIVIFSKRNGINLRSQPILAHTFWSDGILAYLLHRLYGVSYIITVRSTDINIFFKYAVHLRPWMRLIAKSALAIVSPNQAYVSHSKRLRWLAPFTQKMHFIPNPLAAWWFQSIRDPDLAQIPRNRWQACFVGDFSVNKNLLSVIQACKEIRETGLPVRLICVGGDEPQLLRLTRLSRLPDWLEVKGRINDRIDIAKVYRQSACLVVPSFRETFGMVYLEALSQGCSIIYSRGRAIDGIFICADFHYAVDPHSIASIKQAIISACRSEYVESPERLAARLERFRLENVISAYGALLPSTRAADCQPAKYARLDSDG